MNIAELTKAIENLANECGIDLIGFAKADEFENYLLKDSPRQNPRITMPDAKSIIIAGIYIGGTVLPSWDNPAVGRTSRLFLSGYDNDVIEQLKPIAALLKDSGFKAKICDDNDGGESLIPLKLSAIRAGLGWQGKHTLFINRQFGSYLALGGIVTNAELNIKTSEEKNRCGDCNLCMQACPVGALEKDYIINKEKCLSYCLRHDGFPEEYKQHLGNRIVDCEICQDVCPWNKKHLIGPLETKLTIDFKKSVDHREEFFQIGNLLNLTKDAYYNEFEDLATNINYSIFMRNVSIAEENRKR